MLKYDKLYEDNRFSLFDIFLHVSYGGPIDMNIIQNSFKSYIELAKLKPESEKTKNAWHNLIEILNRRHENTKGRTFGMKDMAEIYGTTKDFNQFIKLFTLNTDDKFFTPFKNFIDAPSDKTKLSLLDSKNELTKDDKMRFIDLYESLGLSVLEKKDQYLLYSDIINVYPDKDDLSYEYYKNQYEKLTGNRDAVESDKYKKFKEDYVDINDLNIDISKKLREAYNEIDSNTTDETTDEEKNKMTIDRFKSMGIYRILKFLSCARAVKEFTKCQEIEQDLITTVRKMINEMYESVNKAEAGDLGRIKSSKAVKSYIDNIQTQINEDRKKCKKLFDWFNNLFNISYENLDKANNNNTVKRLNFKAMLKSLANEKGTTADTKPVFTNLKINKFDDGLTPELRGVKNNVYIHLLWKVI